MRSAFKHAAKKFLRTACAGRWLGIPVRAMRTPPTNFDKVGLYRSWLFKAREFDNFSYDLTTESKANLCSWIDLEFGAVMAATIAEIARKFGRNHLVRHDEPTGHWYRGAQMALIK